MRDNISIILPPLYPLQRRAFFNPAPISVVEASTKAGKTVGCIVWLLMQAITESPGKSHLWCAPSHQQTRVAMRRIVRMFRGSLRAGTEPYWEVNRSEGTITLANGSVIYFRSGESPDLIYGPDYSSAVIDEATRCRPELWAAVVSTLTATQGPVRVIGNVTGRRNWVRDLKSIAEAGDPGVAYYKITCLDAVAAGVLSQDAVDRARKTLSADEFRQLYLCEPPDDGGNPFGIDAIARCVAPLSDAQPVAYGIDLAKSQDYTVIIGLDESGTVCEYHRWQRISWPDQARRITGIVGARPCVVDQTGVGSPIVDALHEAGVSASGFVFTDPSRQRLLADLAVAIQSGDIRFPDGPIRAELESFEFVERGGKVRYEAPPNRHDDCVMALGLAWRAHTRGGGPLTPHYDDGGAGNGVAVLHVSPVGDAWREHEMERKERARLWLSASDVD